MNFQITTHRKMLVTLGVGALALTAIACGSAAPKDDLLAGNPPPPELPGGQGDNEFALGVPAPGFEDAGIPEMIVGDPAVDCESGSSHPIPPFIEGEPVYDLGMPAPGFAPADVVEMIVVDPAEQRHVDDGSILVMPVPTLFDVPELIAVDTPKPVDPPSILPTPMMAGTPVVVALPPIAVPIFECDSGPSTPDLALEPISHDMPVPIGPISLASEMIVVTPEVNTAGIELDNEGGDSHDMPVPIEPISDTDRALIIPIEPISVPAASGSGG